MATRVDAEVQDVELELLLEGIFRLYGYDFRDYARASLRRRVKAAMQVENLPSISALTERVLHSRVALERFLDVLSVHVTAMFRDPSFWAVMREQVIPMLRTWPFVRIWHAGCSTGQEVYSLAVVLQEEKLYDRCRIYATDMNRTALETARAGIYPLAAMQKYTSNYLRAGGKRSFSEYYTASHDMVIFNPSLRTNVLFSQHNLVGDGSFNEFNLILCRNVLIYFNETLQGRVHRLMHGSLGMFGLLALGTRESIRFSPFEKSYEELDAGHRIYRKVA